MDESFDLQIEAAKKVFKALEPLNEKSRTFVLRTVVEGLGVRSEAIAYQSGESSQKTEDRSAETSNRENANPQEFLRLKKPASGVEQITCLAYFLKKYRDVEQFKTKDLSALNIEAAGPRLSNVSVFARNAVSQRGYLNLIGGGRKQISDLGEQMVEALPDREKVSEVLKNYRTPRKRSGKKGKAK
ncbi:hypothetical protein K2X33_13620 [bacterium]|nr:hypothetical protein [bacterium]